MTITRRVVSYDLDFSTVVTDAPKQIWSVDPETGRLRTTNLEEFRKHPKVHPDCIRVLEMEQYEQRTPVWYQKRKEMAVTASAIGKIIGLYDNTYMSFEQALRQEVLDEFRAKAYEEIVRHCAETGTAPPPPPSSDSNDRGAQAKQFGIDNEDAACDLYTEITGEPLYRVGLITHPQYPYLGASPDRLTPSGRLVEAKVRKVDSSPI